MYTYVYLHGFIYTHVCVCVCVWTMFCFYLPESMQPKTLITMLLSVLTILQISNCRVAVMLEQKINSFLVQYSNPHCYIFY